jgi:hypothetical protein
MREPGEDSLQPEPIGWPMRIIIGMGMIGILWLGIFPDQILTLAGYSSLALK